jgi:ABC-type transport system involved in multi-copper enzyme maturation permease subunit
MFALIKREIRDHVVFFYGAIILSAVLVGTSISMFDGSRNRWIRTDDSVAGIGMGAAAIIVLGLFGMGAVQMDTDRARRISAFISTLPVGRSRILLAKIFAGILAILVSLVPAALAVTILIGIYTPPVPLYSAMILEVFAGMFLAAFACYCIGLQAGWSAGRVGPVLAGLGSTCILASIILIKGFGPEITVVLAVFIVASLIRIWHHFTSTPL